LASGRLDFGGRGDVSDIAPVRFRDRIGLSVVGIFGFLGLLGWDVLVGVSLNLRSRSVLLTWFGNLFHFL
jgi:hypothetical protein